MKLEPGLPLETLRPSNLSNAAVVKVQEDGAIIVISDFGNLLTFEDEHYVWDSYKIPDWLIEYESMGTPYPLTPIRDRIEQQLRLLRKALKAHSL